MPTKAIESVQNVDSIVDLKGQFSHKLNGLRELGNGERKGKSLVCECNEELESEHKMCNGEEEEHSLAKINGCKEEEKKSIKTRSKKKKKRVRSINASTVKEQCGDDEDDGDDEDGDDDNCVFVGVDREDGSRNSVRDRKNQLLNLLNDMHTKGNVMLIFL